jgi:hypothetical protein
MDTDTIMLADKTFRVPMGLIKDVPISVGPYEYPNFFYLICLLILIAQLFLKELS